VLIMSSSTLTVHDVRTSYLIGEQAALCRQAVERFRARRAARRRAHNTEAPGAEGPCAGERPAPHELTPETMDAVLRGYRTGERAIEAREAVAQFRANRAARHAQTRRARTANGLTEAAAWLLEQQPHLSLSAACRLVVGIVTRYQKAESERTAC
jgi:hypothetical protein